MTLKKTWINAELIKVLMNAKSTCHCTGNRKTNLYGRYVNIGATDVIAKGPVTYRD